MEGGGAVKANVAKPIQGGFAFPLESDLDVFASSFAKVLRAPLVIWLEGDLGTGKTAFARALIHSLGYEGKVKSPTYTLLEEYQCDSLQVLHMDLYRISDPGELEFLGLVDLMDEQTILLVEWPDKGGHWLPEPDFIFRFAYASEGRDMHWTACTDLAQEIDYPT